MPSQTTLLAVTGLSPAIVTETLWALAHEKPRVVPRRVVFVTTATGAAKLREHLFAPRSAFGGRTVWESLRASLKAKPDELIAEEPRVIGRPNNRTGRTDAVADITTRAENEITADFILDEVRRIVENQDTRLIASIAGGRKTMGALLHAAVTLIGRETDRLTHVLVSPPFETLAGFYFPAQPGGALTGPDGRKHPPAKAEIQLADVPFVPLRNRFEDLRDMPGGFDGIVKKISRQIKEDATRPHLIEIDYGRKRVSVDGMPVTMRVKALAILHFLLDCQKTGTVPVDQKAAADDMLQWLGANRSIPLLQKPRGITDADIRHELNYLRSSLKKVRYVIRKRSLHLPPSKLRLFQ